MFEVYKLLAEATDLIAALDQYRGTSDPTSQGIYAGTPDFDNWTDADIVALAPWVRVTSLPGDAADFADDERIAEYPKVQIDFWTPKAELDEQADIEQQLYNTMHKAGWERYYRADSVDADTPQLRMTYAYYQYQGLPIG